MSLAFTRCGSLFLLLALCVPAWSRQPASWRDPSPHSTHFVNVDKDVRLEVLDWGGSGISVVLLAGGGDTAHVFDEFAPKLTSSFHVYGVTRRGFGASTYAPITGGADRLGEDVFAVIRALHLKRPVLVGHSIAGMELSSVANLHPDSIAGVVYLEAAYPYAFDNGSGPTMKEFVDIQGPQAPSPDAATLTSFHKLQAWDARTYGFRLPESEFHQKWEVASEGRITKPRDFPGSQIFGSIMMTPKKYTRIPVPALAIFAIPHVQEAWMTASTDPSIRASADAQFTQLNALAERQARALETGARNAQVIRLRGMHYIYLSHEGEVLRSMRAFIGGLNSRSSTRDHVPR